MEMTRDFIRNAIKEIKAEKDRIKSDLMVKFSTLETILSTLTTNIEGALRYNFPTVQIPSLNMIQPGLINIIDPYSDGINLLQGNSEVITTFKRHIDFLKLVATQEQNEQLDKIFNRYFIYWDNNYFINTYVKKLSQDANTKIPNPVLSLDRVYNILGYNVKNTIKISSSDLDVWGTNAPVTFAYNNNTNMFDLQFDNSLTGTIGLSSINSCPELDINIGHAINRVYKNEFGFDYYKFEVVNNEFIGFITELLITFLFNRYQDVISIKKPEWSYGGFELLYEKEFKLNYDNQKTTMTFSFNQPNEVDSHNNTKKFIEVIIEDWQSTSECNIKVRLANVNQTLHFTLFDRDNKDAAIIFNGYSKNDSSKINDMVLHYFSEDYKLFVLYYGGLLLAKKDEMLLRMNNAITNKLAEQKAEEDIKMQTSLDNKYTKEEQQVIKDAGYQAQAQGKDMTKDNPHPSDTSEYWLWRKGFLEAHNDSN